MTSLPPILALASLSNTVRSLHIARRTVLRVVFIVLALYVAGLSIAVISTQSSANSLFDTDISSTLAEGEIELDRLEDKLGVFNRRFRVVKIWSYPARQLIKLAGVVPVIERYRQGAELLLQRVEIDAAAAGTAIELGRSMFVFRGIILTDSISISDSDDVIRLRDSLDILKFDSLQILDDIELASNAGNSFDELGIVGPLGALSKQMDSQEARLGQVAEFSLLLSEVIQADLELMAQMNSTFDELRTFVNGDVSIRELSNLVNELADETNAISDKALKMVETAPPGVLDSAYGDIVLDLRDLNVSANELITGISTILETAVRSFDLLVSAEGTLLENGEVITEVLQTLIEAEEELSRSTLLITGSIETLLKVGNTGPISLGPLGDVLGDLTAPLLDLSTMLSDAPRIMAEVFAIDGGTSRYLVLGQSSDEIRAAGGFTSSAWLMTFRGGALIRNEYLDIILIEDKSILADYPEAFEELQLHMNAGRMYMRDVGWSPHFPAVGKLAADIYEIGNDLRVDGVISMTQWAFIDLASALGGFETESGFVSSEELLALIEKGTDDQGTGYLSSLFDALMTSLTGGKVNEHKVDLLLTIRSAFESKDLMIYSEDPEIESRIFDIGWDGGLRNSSRDLLAIIDSNVGWNKVDRNITRSFKYELDFTDLTEPRATLNLSYVNNSSADFNCGNQAPNPRSYQDFVHGCYWNYFRVYVPLGAYLTGGDDLPLGDGSIAARVSGLPVGSRTVRQLFDDNGDYISGLLSVAPQYTVDVVLEYILPNQVIKKEGPFLEYSLDVIIQPGIRRRSGSVEIRLPGGYELVDIEPAASNFSNDLIVIDLNLTKNQVIRLKLRESFGPGE